MPTTSEELRHPNGRALTPEELKAARALKESTDEAWEIKRHYSECARRRRVAIMALREQGWSFRRIGEIIGTSGQRIDSMIRMGDRVALSED